MPLPIAVGEVSVGQFGFVQFLDSAPRRFGQAGFISDRVEPGSNNSSQRLDSCNSFGVHEDRSDSPMKHVAAVYNYA